MHMHINVTYYLCSSVRNLYTTRQCIELLQQECAIIIPKINDDWSKFKRTDVVVRRGDLVKDAIKEGKKKRFDATKLLRVSFKS